jgi:MoaA/NifB/PqqE/SkfB family radical SAM enzyme
MTDNFSDILVLNINPKILPDLDFIEKYVANHGSPFNISLFPFSGDDVTNDDLSALNNWSVKLWQKFKGKDLNIKNYLESLQKVDIGSDLIDIINYHENNKNAYYFIDKNGKVTPGSLSIMGEVDYVRLVNKFSTDPDPKKALMLMQKTKPCNMCEYQKECLLSGAYLNMINNSHKIKGAKHCLSGYAPIFELSANAPIFELSANSHISS